MKNIIQKYEIETPRSSTFRKNIKIQKAVNILWFTAFLIISFIKQNQFKSKVSWVNKWAYLGVIPVQQKYYKLRFCEY